METILQYVKALKKVPNQKGYSNAHANDIQCRKKKKIRKDVTVLIRAGKSSAIPGRIGRNRRVVALRRMSGNIAGRRLWGFYIRAHIYGDPRTAKPSPFN